MPDLPPLDGQLQIPPFAKADPNATELIRAWIVDGQIFNVLRVNAWDLSRDDEIQQWGRVLCDTMLQLANALSTTPEERSECGYKLINAFQQEVAERWEKATPGYFEK